MRLIGALLGLALLTLAGASPAGARSLLPGMVYEIDPALPASTEPLGSAPAIQLDGQGGIAAMRLAASGGVLRRGYGQSTLVRNGLDGKPIIANPAGASPGGWDSLVFDPVAADPIAARRGQPFTVALVVRRRAYTSCDIMKLRGKNGTHVNFATMPNGAILIGQNDGPGIATEAAPQPLNQWDILYYVYDGRVAWLLRNGRRTAMTPEFAGGGFGQDGTQVLQVLNGCAMDVAWLGIAAQAPSRDQINAESARLRALFPSVSPQERAEDGLAATNVPAFVRDTDATFLTTPNHPLREPLPVIANALPGDGLAMAPGSRNAFSLVMGSAQRGANMTTAQAIRDRFFLNFSQGDLNKAIGSPMDTGQANNDTFAAVARHYPVGDPNDLHVMAPDGMHLRAICSQLRTDCRPGRVWGAMVRLPFEWRPGTTLKVRYRSPKGDHSWAPIWMFTGQQISPGPGGDPYQGFGTPNALYRPGSGVNFEIDWNDNFSRFSSGVPTGYQIEFGTPDIYGTKWATKPRGVYWANGDGWRYYGPSYNPEFLRTPFDWSEGFHNLVGNWRGDGSNLIDLFVDGKLAATSYMEYPQDAYVDPADGQRKTIAMSLVIGNQAIPGFSRGAASARDNDGIPDGWTIVVQEISGWHGNILNPDRRRASPENGAK